MTARQRNCHIRKFDNYSSKIVLDVQTLIFLLSYFSKVSYQSTYFLSTVNLKFILFYRPIN